MKNPQTGRGYQLALVLVTSSRRDVMSPRLVTPTVSNSVPSSLSPSFPPTSIRPKFRFSGSGFRATASSVPSCCLVHRNSSSLLLCKVGFSSKPAIPRGRLLYCSSVLGLLLSGPARSVCAFLCFRRFSRSAFHFIVLSTSGSSSARLRACRIRPGLALNCIGTKVLGT